MPGHTPLARRRLAPLFPAGRRSFLASLALAGFSLPAKSIAGSASTPNSRAVEIASAHVTAWNQHDFKHVRAALAPDIQFTFMATSPPVAPQVLAGPDAYMTGLSKYTALLLKGSARIVAGLGDERNALLLVTAKAYLGPKKPMIEMPCARIYLLDESGLIKMEQVVFYAAAIGGP